MGLAYAIIQVSQSYVSLSIMQLQGSDETIGLSFFFMVIPEVILFAFVLRFLKRLSHISLISIGMITLLLRWIILLSTNSIPVLLIVSTSHGIVMALVILIGFDLIKMIVPTHLLSSSMSFYTGLANIFFAVLSILSGIIMNNASIKNTYFLYTFTTLLTLSVIIYYIKSYPRRND
jgi:hypothetical protein